MSREWIWIHHDVILAIHEEQLAEHGGSAGTRDKGLLESALARPEHLHAYGLPNGGEPAATDLAAMYAHGIARNHPFIDGNKRTAFVAAELFLELNGYQLNATDAECVLIMLSLASGEIDETAFAAWLCEHTVDKNSPSI